MGHLLYGNGNERDVYLMVYYNYPKKKLRTNYRYNVELFMKETRL